MKKLIDAEWPKFRSRMFDTDMVCLELIRHGAAKDYDAALGILFETGVEEVPRGINIFNMLTERLEDKR